MIKLPPTKISAAIPTYDRYELLGKCIASLIAQDLPAEQFKIIVVDNSPANETAGKFKDRYVDRRNIYYFIEKISGVSNARNVAARLCNSEYIAYIDDDAVADASWLKSILAAFEKFGSKAAIVAGKVTPIWPTEPPKWLPANLSGLTIVDLGKEMRIAQRGEGFAGANFSVRVAPLLELGGFSTSLGRGANRHILLSNEEPDLVDRMRYAGYETIWAPDANVDHLVTEDRINQGWLRKRYVWQAVSDFISRPDETIKNLEERWQSIAHYMQHLPPSRRTPRAFFESTEDPSLFEKQLYAGYCLTVLLLAGKELHSHESLEDAMNSRSFFYLKRFLPQHLLRSMRAFFGSIRSSNPK